MTLEFNIEENNLATELYFIDETEWDNAVYLDNVTSYTFTFQSLILPDNTLDPDVNDTGVTFTKTAPSSPRFELTGRYIGAIYPSDLVADWVEFPEGVYNVEISVVVDQGTNPTNNPLQYAEVLYAQTKEYKDQLAYQIGRNITTELADDNFTLFALNYYAKFQSLKAAIDISGTGLELTTGNTDQVSRIHNHLIDLRDKYPIGDKVKRYYDNRTLR